MKKILSALIASAVFCSFADDSVTLVESAPAAPNIKSGDIVQIGDFQFVVLSVSDFERMNVAICDMRAKWNAMNSNETGRVALHGKRVHKTIGDDVITVEYEDGYVHVGKANRSAIKPMSRPKTTRSTDAAQSEFEKARVEMRKRRHKALSTTNEVSVTIGR